MIHSLPYSFSDNVKSYMLEHARAVPLAGLAASARLRASLAMSFASAHGQQDPFAEPRRLHDGILFQCKRVADDCVLISHLPGVMRQPYTKKAANEPGVYGKVHPDYAKQAQPAMR